MSKFTDFWAKVKTAFGKFFTWIGADGLLHFIVSIALVLWFGMFFKWWVAALVAFGIGCLKEMADYFFPNHNASVKDIICDSCGTIVGVGLYFIGKLIAALF